MADCQISPMTDKCGPSQTSSKDLSTIPEGRVGQGKNTFSSYKFVFLCFYNLTEQATMNH